jgi:hypothetical protein
MTAAKAPLRDRTILACIRHALARLCTGNGAPIRVGQLATRDLHG